MDRRAVALRASAGGGLVLVLVGGLLLAMHGSPPAEALPQSPSPSLLTDPTTSASSSTSALTPIVNGSLGSPPLAAGKDVLVLGDSLGLDVYPWLADLLPDRYVGYAAVVGRDTPNTLVALNQLTVVPPVVLVSLGTNDVDPGSFRRAADGILTTLGPKRCVMWADVARPDSVGGGPASINAVIDDLATTHPNVSVFRWSDLVAQHPDWLSGDGIHPGETGAQARAQAFANATLACSPLDASAPKASRDFLPASAFLGPGGKSVQGVAPTYSAPASTAASATHSATGHPTSPASSSAPTVSSTPSSSAPSTSATSSPTQSATGAPSSSGPP